MKYRLRYEAPFADIEKIYSAPTGTWRHKRPLINRGKCSRCGWCHLYCPGGSMIEREGNFSVDLKFCKGCGLCARVCPSSAILMVQEG
ncbi:MAG: 4Fe-4S binding protein [Deltaproteobacteria bacterium]|nr:4Fe-4S binding protein [Deltaproteobacteria bacterium]